MVHNGPFAMARCGSLQKGDLDGSNGCLSSIPAWAVWWNWNARGEAMSKKELKERVHNELGGSKAQADRVVSAFLDSMQQALVEGREIKLNNLGSFKLVHKKPRTIRHPQSGRAIEVPGGTGVKFKPGKRLNARINSEPD